jgi:hypothetical protein
VKSLDICPNSSLRLKEKTKQIPFKEDNTSLTPRKVQQAFKEMDYTWLKSASLSRPIKHTSDKIPKRYAVLRGCKLYSDM